MKLEQLDHITLMVKDPARSMVWYQSVLGLERRYEAVWGDRPIMVGAGSTCIAFFPLKPGSFAPIIDVNTTLAMHHLAFRTDHRNFVQAKAELERQNIAFEFHDHSIACSIYLKDPDGHKIEITTYDLPKP